jgi:aryl-alcohol dehydrogenase-like predicted oxidoreductase
MPAMIKRLLGSTDMAISAVGIGAFGIGGWLWGEQDDADSKRALHAALDHGVNWIDSAPIYGSGRADRVVAEVLRERPADAKPLIFTKFGHHLVAGQRVSIADRATVLRDCEYALKTFAVERIDLFQLHWPSPTPIAETASACAELISAGKIRALGVSNVSLAELTQWQATGVPVRSVQNAYSVVKPEAEREVLPWCAAHGVGFLAYSPLQRGLLFGGWTADKRFPAGDHRGERADFRGRRLARYLAAVDELKAIAAADDMDVAELAIGCLMCHEGMTACIVGARSAEQGAYLGRLGMPATKSQLTAVDAVCVRLFADLEGIGEG